ncbi:hypothetical protein MUGA111182_13505 [Mucilaginibacter galii]
MFVLGKKGKIISVRHDFIFTLKKGEISFLLNKFFYNN